jgi:hypothetical protein
VAAAGEQRRRRPVATLSLVCNGGSHAPLNPGRAIRAPLSSPGPAVATHSRSGRLGEWR